MKSVIDQIKDIGFGNEDFRVSETIFYEFVNTLELLPNGFDDSYYVINGIVEAYRTHGFVSDSYFIPKYKKLMQKSFENNKKWLEERNIPFKIIPSEELGFNGLAVDLDHFNETIKAMDFLEQIKKWPYEIL